MPAVRGPCFSIAHEEPAPKVAPIMPSRILLPLILLAMLGLTACENPNRQEQINQRNAAIAAETPGDYFIGRRFFIDRTHFWGYVRKPGQPWQSSKLVVLNEKLAKAPDRLLEVPTDGSPAFGYDHNCEYRLWGYYSGRKVYDPNSDLFLPEFVLQRFQLISDHPGWLFMPNERFNGNQLLRSEPEAMP